MESDSSAQRRDLRGQVRVNRSPDEPKGGRNVLVAMREAARLRDLAAQCRRRAASLHAEATAATLREMARAFEANAEVTERLPLLKAIPRERPW